MSNIEKIYAKDKLNSKEVLVYKIDSLNKKITFYPMKDRTFSQLKKFELDGFEELPKEFSESGYLKSNGGLPYHLNKKIEEQKISILIISRKKQNQFCKLKSGNKLVLNYNSFQEITEKFKHIDKVSKDERKQFADNFFKKNYPDFYLIKAKKANKNELGKLLELITEDMLNNVSQTELLQLEQYYNKVIKNKQFKNKNFVDDAKHKIDLIKLDKLIEEFEANLKNVKFSEADWGKFLKGNLFFIEPTYVNDLPQLNVQLCTTRKMDFALLDIYGYTDIYEIKKPSTKILDAKPDHGNYVWSSEATKAIIQAEKYLFNAERKAPSIVEDTRREKDMEISIIRPRAFVIMGLYSSLQKPNQKDDFRIIKNSLKNVQIICYDELLDGLKELRKKLQEILS